MRVWNSAHSPVACISCRRTSCECALSRLSLTSNRLGRYFTKDGQHGVCIFRRRKTAEEGHRGFRLSSLGILLAQSTRPRAWRHVQALKELQQTIYDAAAERDGLELLEGDWGPAKAFFEERRVLPGNAGGAGDWNGWSQELDGVRDFLFLPHLFLTSRFFSRTPTHWSQRPPCTSPISSAYSARPH